MRLTPAVQPLLETVAGGAAEVRIIGSTITDPIGGRLPSFNDVDINVAGLSDKQFAATAHRALGSQLLAIHWAPDRFLPDVPKGHLLVSGGRTGPVKVDMTLFPHSLPDSELDVFSVMSLALPYRRGLLEDHLGALAEGDVAAIIDPTKMGVEHARSRTLSLLRPDQRPHRRVVYYALAQMRKHDPEMPGSEWTIDEPTMTAIRAMTSHTGIVDAFRGDPENTWRGMLLRVSEPSGHPDTFAKSFDLGWELGLWGLLFPSQKRVLSEPHSRDLIRVATTAAHNYFLTHKGENAASKVLGAFYSLAPDGDVIAADLERLNMADNEEIVAAVRSGYSQFRSTGQ